MTVQLPQDTLDLLKSTPKVGQRHNTMLEIAYRCGEAGWTNDQILDLLDDLAQRWGKYPGRFTRWTKLLGMLRAVRKGFPNSPDGSGYRPGREV